MVLSCSNNAPTTGDHYAGVHTPVLLSYPVSTPPLADHLIDNQQQQRAYWLVQVPSFCPPKTGDEHVSLTVDWSSVRRTCKEWLKNPMNIALILWLLCVGVSGGMLVLLLLGLLDGAFPAPTARNRWIEINNQVLNALFTLMSLYQHPALCHHLFLLCRWRPHDAAELRAAYCKDGAAAAGERAHMAVVVALLHLTVACQYVLCGLYWRYTKTTRPELAEDGLFALGVVAPAVAAVYTVCSPLGKADHCELACSGSMDSTTTKQQPSPIGRRIVVEPEWAGGMFDCGGDAATACLSLSCTFCVFGWNMERLGLGNRYVHAVTFVLLCFAPLWVLGVSALHIHEYVIGDVVGGAGVLLCACGLLYGGYWRIQIRTRFGLPGSRACCGSKSLTDHARWLFCWPCALAQEVRTASLYHVDGESFYQKVVDDDGVKQPLLASNHHDVFSATDTVAVSHGSPTDHLVVVRDEVMVPPVRIAVVQREDDKSAEGCSAVHGETIDPSIPISVAVRVRNEDESSSESKLVLVEEVETSGSNGSWRVEKVKKLINMITLVSLLILLYTRGFIRWMS